MSESLHDKEKQRMNSHERYVSGMFGAFDKLVESQGDIPNRDIDDALIYEQVLSPAAPDEACIVASDNKVHSVKRIINGTVVEEDAKVYFYTPKQGREIYKGKQPRRNMYVTYGKPDQDGLTPGHNGFDFFLLKGYGESAPDIQTGDDDGTIRPQTVKADQAEHIRDLFTLIQKQAAAQKPSTPNTLKSANQGRFLTKTRAYILALGLTATLTYSFRDTITQSIAEWQKETPEETANREMQEEADAAQDAIDAERDRQEYNQNRGDQYMENAVNAERDRTEREADAAQDAIDAERDRQEYNQNRGDQYMENAVNAERDRTEREADAAQDAIDAERDRQEYNQNRGDQYMENAVNAERDRTEREADEAQQKAEEEAERTERMRENFENRREDGTLAYTAYARYLDAKKKQDDIDAAMPDIKGAAVQDFDPKTLPLTFIPHTGQYDESLPLDMTDAPSAIYNKFYEDARSPRSLETPHSAGQCITYPGITWDKDTEVVVARSGDIGSPEVLAAFYNEEGDLAICDINDRPRGDIKEGDSGTVVVQVLDK